ncbi:MAG: riboflavin kinase [Desulfobacterales bacterium]
MRWQILGRYYQIRGRSWRPELRGRLLGFPTANINIVENSAPKPYAATVECLNSHYKGVANIGYSPTLMIICLPLKFILDFNGDLYGHDIRVNFIKRIRDERKF